MTTEPTKKIEALVANDLGNGYIKVTVYIDRKIHELCIKRSVAVSVITALAQALDGNLHTM
jgi:hypothetical protein